MTNRRAIVSIDEVLQGLDKLSVLREPIARAMGVAMGQEVRDEAKDRAPVLKPGNEGVDNQRAGQLRDAMYLAFDGRRSVLNQGHYVYTVSWNAAKAPHGHLAEFGHFMPFQFERTVDGRFYTPLVGTRKVEGRKRGLGIPNPHAGFFVDAQPFLGPAFDAKLSKLNRIAADAAAIKFTEVMK